MNYFRVHGALVAGIQANPVQVECAQSRRLPYLQIIGASGAHVAESRERVIAALESCKIRLPARRTTVQIQPGAYGMPLDHLDLAIAVAILGSARLIPPQRAENLLFCGSLGLDGGLRPLGNRAAVRRLLKKSAVRSAILPWEGSEILEEAHLLGGGGFRSLQELVEFLRQGPEVKQGRRAKGDPELFSPAPARIWDQIEGQEVAKRMLETAAAGAHHILFPGPSGARADLLAHALSSLLPPLSESDAEEVAAIYALAGWDFLPSRPFVSFAEAPLPPFPPSKALAKVEEVLLAHRGVFFVDRICEREAHLFPALLQPMRSGTIFARLGQQRAEIPVDPIVVAASPACACGAKGNPFSVCTCRPTEARRYQERWRRLLQYPFDLCLPLSVEGGRQREEESPEERADRVQCARGRMFKRQGKWNGRLQEGEIFEVKAWNRQAESLWRVFEGRQPGQRNRFFSLAKVALTLSDLRGGEEVEERDLLEAKHYFPEAFSGPEGRRAASPSVPAVNSMAIP